MFIFAASLLKKAITYPIYRAEKARLILSREKHLPARPLAEGSIHRDFTSDLLRKYYSPELNGKIEYWELCQLFVSSGYVKKTGEWRINVPNNLCEWIVEPPTKEQLLNDIQPYLAKVQAIVKKYDWDRCEGLVGDAYDLNEDGAHYDKRYWP